ncbi:MAG: hypothetical protein HZA36_03895 [Parcubacteria group bacterium]|nr:hypothetical protein [Parcubacteria group bacterium]
MNLTSRSRTARGISDTSTSKDKKKLLKEGADLKAQVRTNTKRLIQMIWRIRTIVPNTPTKIRILMECWYDCINDGLQDPTFYKERHKELETIAARRRELDGKNWRINRRYRVWSVSYTTFNPDPLELEFEMDTFYKALFKKILQTRWGTLEQAELLAFADLMIDGEIHPWADGCARNATATIMWLSLITSPSSPLLPVFKSREEHYATIRDLGAHTRYFEQCLAPQ